MIIEARQIHSGEVIKVELRDLGLRTFKGHRYYTTRFILPWRKKSLISRTDPLLAEASWNVLNFRMSEDNSALESVGLTI